MTHLPVETILEKLNATLEKNTCAVLQAPPGAGKTTRVPLALLDGRWLAGRRILMLEPRRLATRAAAARMASNLGQRVGETVGYRMRMESRIGPRTRIEVLTEGVLTRLLQHDPSLAGVGLVIFDEFHERSLAADLALALCLDVQGVLNDSLRLLAMSATLDSQALSQIMNQAPVVSCEGKQFPVETVYAGPGRAPTLVQNTASAVKSALGRYAGSLSRYLMANGRGACFNVAEPLSAQEYLVVTALDGDRRETRIFLAAGYDKADLADQYGDRIKKGVQVGWDSAAKAVLAVQLRTFGALTLKRTRFEKAPAEEVLAAMAAGIRREGLACLPWTKPLRSWQVRVLFLRRMQEADEGWPDVSDKALIDTLETWLVPYLDGVTRLKQLDGIDLKNALYGLLSWRRQRLLDELAPTHLRVPSGTRVPIDYGSDPPVVPARIQQMFGATKTPAIAGGRQPLVLHLLSPAGRPMQITTDLAGFWANSYHAVKKDLKARYPKHHRPGQASRLMADNFGGQD